ncbi:MAG: hypothetical protein V1859_05165 [archaeon]
MNNFNVPFLLLLSLLISGCSVSHSKCGADFLSEYKSALAQDNVSFCDVINERGSLQFKGSRSCQLQNGSLIFAKDCFVSFAAKTQNISICKYTFMSDDCLSQIQNLDKNPALCNDLDQKQDDTILFNYFDECVKYTAFKTLNDSICNQINDYFTNGLCNYNIAKQTLNPELCKKIKSFQNIDACFIDVAVGNKDISMCVNNIINKDKCYNSFAIKFLDSSWCSEIISQETKDNCLGFLGRELMDSTLCTTISSCFLRETCISESKTGKMKTGSTDIISTKCE